ncbi:MAG: Transcriptional regulator, AsnC family [uncultured Paraburkholderia sp.]|nr:MAG: Transcriptional regulator, AsnC family [uncultured Paraburkholderia sp.]CAH2914293.1 MAG: Transcriptional regulator, AsnC family [uncultured Paraburkholderia sp.]
MPIAELAQRVNLSQTPCWKRLQRLKETGVIRAQVALCDARNLGVRTGLRCSWRCAPTSTRKPRRRPLRARCRTFRKWSRCTG